jgi:thiamine monophosphate synthase
MTPERVARVLAAGAAGVAVRSAVWDAPDPIAAATAFAASLAGV